MKVVARAKFAQPKGKKARPEACVVVSVATENLAWWEIHHGSGTRKHWLTLREARQLLATLRLAVGEAEAKGHTCDDEGEG